MSTPAPPAEPAAASAAASVAAPAAASAAAPSLARRVLREPQAVVGLALVVGFALLAVFAPLVAPLDPIEQHAAGLSDTGMPRPPGFAADGAFFALGTDNLGRDLLSRIIFGARVSLIIGLMAMLTAVGIGATIGLLAGYFRGWLELVLMRLTDVMLAMPTLILAIASVAVWTPAPITLHLWGGTYTIPGELVALIVVIGLVNWTGIARITRAETLRVASQEYIEAARVIGCSPLRTLAVHVLPNVLPTIIVLASLATANTILLDAGLSYLGLGVQPPTPSWGKMIAEGQPYLVTAPMMVLGPGLCVVLAVLGFNLVGQGLQSAMDPHRTR